MKTRENDVVAEYLREVDQRLAGLPVLQRRELLNDLAAHIAAEQAERNLASEGEIIEVLERLGSPEVVAAAAHEENGTRFTPPPPAANRNKLWLIVGIVAAVVLVLVTCGFLAFAGADSSIEGPAQPAVTAPETLSPS
ncbi:hypothetical protein M1L60_22550 [Actinoplanes sp. TRM 88003]|uniref:Uncharacterized protein n=1 Tax=Paractinoplanes aksuensis TaxID=2939490 RepID=A0ABT1DRC7_9ACTN|nr:hypothetical protein [Actinoplanes aksuensis]MCO8273377.1 hypothetical protein [Actinoplanes aksuensis]